MALPNNTTDRNFQSYRSGDNPGETKVGVQIAGRVAINLQNNSAADVFLNFTSGAATGDSYVLRKNSEKSYSIDDTIIIYGRTASGTRDIIIEELS
jgi:hypothetical protein